MTLYGIMAIIWHYLGLFCRIR